ncbi:hypothetical protein E1B28_003095 [Marasmius oreades]|uniref:Uncharacterized protein n=1 Tax=Marasmius oreades TaxID=181124 RepID=A0A9P7RLG5_9AGAR|nr:uncharacterized protein E1B28_003095 [Marasmius oreades]KAG7085537.1 hypothetical protein E1B28_003095 [Marasmius oreades]
MPMLTTIALHRFDSTPDEFQARGVYAANANPHRDLTPLDYSKLPAEYLTALGGTTRITKGFPRFICAKERWSKNINLAMLQAVDLDRGRWLACII